MADLLIGRIQKLALPTQKEVHLKIGQLMLRNLPEPERLEKIFDNANHFSIGFELIDIKEHLELALVFLNAGEKAKTTGAFEQAYTYFKQGIHLLETDGWENHNELMMKLHMAGMEAWVLYNGLWGANVRVNFIGSLPVLKCGPDGPAYHDSWPDGKQLE